MLISNWLGFLECILPKACHNCEYTSLHCQTCETYILHYISIYSCKYISLYFIILNIELPWTCWICDMCKVISIFQVKTGLISLWCHYDMISNLHRLKPIISLQQPLCVSFGEQCMSSSKWRNVWELALLNYFTSNIFIIAPICLLFPCLVIIFSTLSNLVFSCAPQPLINVWILWV